MRSHFRSRLREALQAKVHFESLERVFHGSIETIRRCHRDSADRQRFHEKLPSERAHYSAQTYDHEVLLDRWGWIELAGHAYRTDFDLKAHMKAQASDMRVFKPYDRPIRKIVKRVIPHLPVLGRKFGRKD